MLCLSVNITLTEDGKVTGDKTGTWKLDKSDGTGDMTITLDGVEYHGAFDRLPRDKDDRKVEMTFSVLAKSSACGASQKSAFLIAALPSRPRPRPSL